MPVYEYRCEECGHIFDQLRRMDEMDESINCPQCGSQHTKRKMSVFGVGSSGGESECQVTGGSKPPSCGG
ncbi:FmdB family zinc ribbon protein [Anoxynatronum buryatiense]|uniref:Regulatory protein, FmdB family n=1 Tax=Anoxynatronum buryatiense TaxID=489973 RepID=A0AA46AI34_9CLOT|nr:zinc ribbon domain-containing protein [Anoxynatronum buryatiense]SMP46513.1 putative regulatory protein, FmdB family [Anoxynatronum buryatiense]